MKDLIICGCEHPGIVQHLKYLNNEKAEWNILGFLSDGFEKNVKYLGYQVFGGYDLIPKYAKNKVHFFNNTFKDASTREQISKKIIEHNGNVASIIVPGSDQIEHLKVDLGKGCYVTQNAFIEGPTTIGDFVVVREGALISHDSEIGSFTIIGEHATLLGWVRVGEKTNIGAGVLIRDRVKIGNNCTIKEGAVVVRNVPDNATIVGVPGRVVKG